MEFNSFLSLISNIDRVQLGGMDSHKKMIPKQRKLFDLDYIKQQNPKKAAVMALFYPNIKNETTFLLTLRASYNGTHSAQISFPGGKFEKTDMSLENTVLRETFEEVGIPKRDIEIKKQLSDTFIPPSNFMVTPFLGIVRQTPLIKHNYEVKEIIEVSLAHLLDDKFKTTKNLSTSYMKNIDVPCYKLNNYTVWGATAMMLSEIKDLLQSI